MLTITAHASRPHRYIRNKIIFVQGYCHSWYNVQNDYWNGLQMLVHSRRVFNFRNILNKISEFFFFFFFFDMVDNPSLILSIVPLPREVDGNPNLSFLSQADLWWQEIKLWKPFYFLFIEAGSCSSQYRHIRFLYTRRLLLC